MRPKLGRIIIYINHMSLPLTPREEAVIRELRRRRVATMRTLRNRRGCCHMTGVRALQKTVYHNSFNANAAYYALPETVVFDADGLWFHRQIGFSRHGNRPQTLVALVERSPAGSKSSGADNTNGGRRKRGKERSRRCSKPCGRGNG